MNLPDFSRSHSVLENPPLGFRFGVCFLIGGGDSSSLDAVFQKVSGIGATVDTFSIEEGGQNLYTQKAPTKIQYDNLVLERGAVVYSWLTDEFNAAMSRFKFRPSNVLVTLLDHTSAPLASWLFINAYPVKWNLSDLDATQNNVVIQHMELTYQHFRTVTL